MAQPKPEMMSELLECTLLVCDRMAAVSPRHAEDIREMKTELTDYPINNTGRINCVWRTVLAMTNGTYWADEIQDRQKDQSK